MGPRSSYKRVDNNDGQDGDDVVFERNTSSRSLPSLVLATSAIFLALVILLVTTSGIGSRLPKEDVLDYIDPLIGTGPGGHVFAGATLPFGMAKPVADVTGEHMGGFASDNTAIQGFSHLHDSGTGGSPSMGNFPLFVHPKCQPNDCKLDKSSRSVHYHPESVKATPGYFTIDLVSGLRAEMTASERAALYRFSFVHDQDNATAEPVDLSPLISADGTDLPRSYGQRTLRVDPKTGRMTGEGIFNPSFGVSNYNAFFCADIKGAEISETGTWNGTLQPGGTSVEGTGGHRQLVYVALKDVHKHDSILVRVGLSWLSIDRACENAENQIHDWNFERLRNEAADIWRKKLSPVKLNSKGVDKQHLRNFWSGVYRALLSPQDYTGENQLWNSTEPYYDSWYCIWDTFRGVHPFLTLIDTISQSRMVRSLIDIQKHAGWLPDCRMSFCKGYTQGGSNADVVVVDGFLKGLPDIDWDAAYAAIVKDAEEQPPNWNIEGRGGLSSWKTIGYIPYKDNEDQGVGHRTRSISRTVEYAYNDFCIAEMANATGRYDDYEKYIGRASNWKNVMKLDHQSMGFTGFPQPRWKNGSFAFQNATLCSHLNNFDGCYFNPSGHETYEGSPWLYNFYVPGDYAGLVSMTGGKAKFLEKLNKLHDSGVLYMGDEQAFMMAMLYHWVGRPGLSALKTHQYIPSMFNDTIAGIPGNDDSGAMGTFVLFSMLGLFPIAGTRVYLITAPYFPSLSITNPHTKKTATVRNVNFDANYKRIHVQSAKLNGKDYTKNWLDHRFFTEGGTLELVLGEEESSWGTREEDVPPSLSTGLYLGMPS